MVLKHLYMGAKFKLHAVVGGGADASDNGGRAKGLKNVVEPRE